MLDKPICGVLVSCCGGVGGVGSGESGPNDPIGLIEESGGIGLVAAELHSEVGIVGRSHLCGLYGAE